MLYMFKTFVTLLSGQASYIHYILISGIGRYVWETEICNVSILSAKCS